MSLEISDQLHAELKAAAAGCDCELLDCEFKGGILRLVIDRPGGVGLDDCQAVSKQASALLDVAEFGAGRYTLEVSSPGLDRKFYSKDDFERFCGRLARVTWKQPELHHKRTVVGHLRHYSRSEEEILLVDSVTGEGYTIPLKHIELARLEPEL